MLNRADRRRLARATNQGRPSGFRGVILRGGPKDGLIVTPDAPILGEEWWRSWNESVVVLGRPRSALVAPGRYVRDTAAQPATAEWQPFEEAAGV